MENLRTEAPPNNILAVGFKIRLKNRTFLDGTTSKIVEMKRFTHWPDSQSVHKYFELK